MEKLDLRKQLKHLCQPSAQAVQEVQVPAFTFLMVDGQGDPDTSRMDEAARKKDLPALARLRIGEFTEGRCAQALHGGSFTGIHLMDIRRTDPSRWKTVIRQPME